MTFAYLEKIPFRLQVKDRLMQLYDYPKFSAPVRRGEYFFYSKNDGLQNQSVRYIQKGLDGTPEVLIDPNKFSEDGTSRLTLFALSKGRQIRRLRDFAGRLRLAGIPRHGYREQTDPAGRARSGSRSPGSRGRGTASITAAMMLRKRTRSSLRETKDHKVFYHRSARRNPPTNSSTRTRPTRSGSTLSIRRKTNASSFSPSRTAARARRATRFSIAMLMAMTSPSNRSSAEIGDDTFYVVDNVGDKFMVRTDRKAPNSRVFLFDPASPGENDWKDILPERPEPLESVSSAGGKLFATYLKDVTTRAYVYGLDGKLENEITLPGPGTAVGFGGREGRQVRVLHLYVLQLPAHDLPLRHRDAADLAVPRTGDPGFQARRL